MRVGIFTDYPQQTVLSGPAIHTAFLKRNLERRGHAVTLYGPNNGGNNYTSNEETHLFRGVAYPTHPKTKVVMPWPMKNILHPPKVDIIHGQINTHMIHYGGWMRRMWRIPMLNTHILHLPTHSHFLVGDSLYKNPWVRAGLEQTALGVERAMAQMVNEGDGFIVQSRHMREYWRERGVTVPIEVVGRPINPEVFSAPAQEDPFPQHFVRGRRLVVVCRHDREKSLDELIRIFDEHIAAADHEVTLTLVGNGADHENLVAQAQACRHADRIAFPGEVAHERLVDWYAHADVFVYTSVSETFGNVVNEALWCGLPTVAYNDNMGVAHQVRNEVNGFLIEPQRTDSHASFARGVLLLLHNRNLLQQMGQQAATIARQTSHPDVVIDRFEKIYERALRRCHDEIKTPLSEQSRRAQLADLSQALRKWTVGHGSVLGVAAVATRTGLGRKIEDHDTVLETAPKRRDEHSGIFEAIRGRFESEARDAAE